MAKKRFELCVYDIGSNYSDAVCQSQESFEGTEHAMRKRAQQLAQQGPVRAFDYHCDELSRIPCDTFPHKPAAPADSIDPLPIARMAFPEWRGRKVTLVRKDMVQIIGTAWDGGSKSTFVAVNIATGTTSEAQAGIETPREFGGTAGNHHITIPQGFAVVEHIVFCGKELGCRVYLANEPALGSGADRTHCIAENSTDEFLSGTVVHRNE